MISKRRLVYERVIHSVPGKYFVSLSFELDGKPYGKEIEVTNPAFGFAELEDWEGLILKRYNARRNAA